ncbi:MAG: hypothetical protein VYA30_06335 [Myxococcota bacterium]|nr:hypothetical protein [Myxococcota bacterium]
MTFGRHSLAFVASLFLLWTGCQNDLTVPAEQQDASRSQRFDAGRSLPANDASPGSNLSLRIQFTPNKPVYKTGDIIRLKTFNTDTPERPVELNGVTYSARPSTVLRPLAASSFECIADGQAKIQACASNGVCTERPVRIQSTPLVRFEPPIHGTRQGGRGTIPLTLTGSVSNTQGDPRLVINETPVDVDSDGRFSHALAPRFGLNRLQVTIADDINVVPSQTNKYFIWAPTYHPANAGVATIPDAITARLDQAALDTPGRSFEVSGNEFRTTTLAGLMELIFEYADLRGILATTPPVEAVGLRLAVEDIQFTRPDVELEIVSSGAELFGQMANVRLITNGYLDIDGRRASLDGSVIASIAFFSLFDVSYPNIIDVEIPEYDISITALQGDYLEPTINTLISGLDTQIGVIARGLVRDLASDVITRTVPDLFELGFSLLETEISSLPLTIDAQVPGIPVSEIEISLDATVIDHSPRRGSILKFDAIFRHGQELEPRPDDPGVAAIDAPAYQPAFGNGIGVVIDLGLFNAICHEIWRAGVFRATPQLPESVSSLVGEVEFNALIPPIIGPPNAGSEDTFRVSLGAFELKISPLGGEGVDTYTVAFDVGMQNTTAGATISMQTNGAPVIQIELLSALSGQPLEPDFLRTMITTTVWPEIESALNSGLRYGIDNVIVGIEELSPITSSINQLRFGPVLDDQVRYDSGRFVFGGRLEVTGQLVAE